MDTVVIRYVGGGVRHIDSYSWTKENGFETAVDAELAAQLLTYPRRQFEIVKQQTLTPGAITHFAEAFGVEEKDVYAQLGMTPPREQQADKPSKRKGKADDQPKEDEE